MWLALYSFQRETTALMEASGAGHAEVVTALIAAGADVDAATKVLRYCARAILGLHKTLCGSHFLLAVRTYGTHEGIRGWSPGGSDGVDRCRG
jgi:hypothetical protein